MTCSRAVRNLSIALSASILAIAVAGCRSEDDAGSARVLASTRSGTAGGEPGVPNTLPLPDPSAPVNAPHGKADKGRLSVVVPPEVQATWKAVELSITPSGGKAQPGRVAVGGELAVRKSKTVVRVLAFLPAFQITNAGVTSRSNELENPAVLVRLSDGDRTIAEGWVFQKLPQFDTFKSDQVRIVLLGADKKK